MFDDHLGWFSWSMKHGAFSILKACTANIAPLADMMYPLVMTNIAMEAMALIEIDDFPS